MTVMSAGVYLHIDNMYRIAGKFGEFHCYERLARKSLANG